ncbi:MAG: ATP-binding protein, partial [Bacteroidia bacterium]|nr:ATP-binding protein [Bacteroidia bacterium]
DDVLQFAFLTGVSKFTKTSIFSGLNNLYDITLEKKFATICGYTDKELQTNFAEYLDGIDLQEVKKWYNGYCWDIDEPTLYNPYDVLKFLNSKKFKSHWFESGTPSFLIQLIQEKHYYLPDLESVIADDTLLSTFDIEDTPIISLLWQTGYLTIKNQFTDENNYLYYELQYPNFEVEKTLNSILFRSIWHNNPVQFSISFLNALRQQSITTIEQHLKSLFAGISYSFSQNIQNYEGFYGSVIYSFFKGLGLNAIIEDHTNIGRIDLSLLLKESIYLFEFKLKHHQENPLQQIKSKKYYEKYSLHSKPIYLIGIVFDPQQKNICQFEW